MKRRFFIFALVPGCVLILWHSQNSAPFAAEANQPPSIGQQGVANSPPLRQTVAQKSRDVLQVVSARNKVNAREHATFEQAGWTKVDAGPPRAEILALTEDALKNRLPEVQVQMQTANLPVQLSPRLKEIALNHEDTKTRMIATEALVTSKNENTIRLVRELFHDSQDSTQRAYLLRSVMAQSQNDEAEDFFEEVVRTGNETDRNIALNQLVVAYLVKKTSTSANVPSELMARVPEALHQEAHRIYRTILGIN